MKSKHLASILLALAALLAALPARAVEVKMTVAPAAIAIDTLYNGTTLTITGEVPAGSEIVTRLIGAPAELHMKEKGKVMGLLWMNLGSLTFKGVPGVYLVGASRDFSALGPTGQALLPEGMKDAVEIESEGTDKAASFAELLKLKRSEGLYREDVGTVRVTPGSGEASVFTAEISVPSRLSPGSYTVETVALKDGEIVGKASAKVEASLVSAPAFLAELAFGNGALYGVLATVIALLGGLAIGMVFQSKGAH